MHSMANTARRIILCFLLLPLAAAALHAAEPRPDCRICGMWIDQYMRTRHVFTARDGSQVMFCSLTCAARHLQDHAPELKRLEVADYLTTELIDSKSAIYLAGSDVPPVMSNTSIIAFGNRQEAERFQQQHGGRLLDFTQALALE